MAEEFLTLMAEYDDATQQVFRTLQAAIDAAGFTGSHSRDIPYHISLATFRLDQEAEAVALMGRLAAKYGPISVEIPRIGTFPGNRVLFAAPEATSALMALQADCGVELVGGYPWSPHSTLLIDVPEVVERAIPVAEAAFRPFRGTITRLHLCAFWPTREVLAVALQG